MEDTAYSSAEKKTNRRYIYAFHVLNPISFTFLAGNVITLLLLRLKAGNFLIGLMSSFIYISHVFMPLGKKSIARNGLVKTFGFYWTIRYLGITPIMAAPFLAAWSRTAAIMAVLVGYLCFQIFRGAGTVSFSPVMKELSEGKGRGDFLAKSQIILQVSTIVSGLIVVLLLGKEAPLYRYSIFALAGIIAGISGALTFLKISEPRTAGAGANEKFKDSFKQVISNRTYRRFFLAFALFIFMSNLGKPFFIVYAKQVYSFGDNEVFLFTLFGSLGAIFMGIINKNALDRLGFKPLIIIFAAIYTISLTFPAFMPRGGTAFGWIIVTVMFFIGTMGAGGVDMGSQAYFFQMIDSKNQINLGIIYYIIMGVTGAVASVIGGYILDLIQTARGGGPPIKSFHTFYQITLMASLLPLFFWARIERQGAHTLRGAIAMLFSPRDWRAMSLLNKLDKSPSVDEERQVIRDIRGTSSALAVDDILSRLDSSSFSIRREALYTIANLPWDKRVEEALIRILKEHEFSNAHHAARLLGRSGSTDAVEALREALNSRDYLLQANAALALAEIGDGKSRELIENLLREAQNPRIIIYSLAALSKIDDPSSILPVLTKYADPELPDMVKDEIIFALSNFWGASYNFYSEYRDFLKSDANANKITDKDIRKTASPTEAGQYLIDNRGIIDKRLAFLIRYLRSV